MHGRKNGTKRALAGAALWMAAVGISLAAPAPNSATAAPAGDDAKAMAVADAVMKAGGGADAWAAVKYIRFSFVVERDGKTLVTRTHYWDRVGNRHRIEGTDKEGKSVVCVSYLPAKEGVCSVGDKVVMDDEAKPYVEREYGQWINDTYWLLMPYKMKDPGVHLKLDGEAKVGANVYDKVLLTFEDVGMTPKDRYWAFVNRKTHVMDRWEYVLQDDKGQPGTGEPEMWEWKGWNRYGGVMLATDRISKDGKTKILFKDVAVFDDLPDSVFSKTSKVELPKTASASGRP
jgi:hypothetical protein